MNKAKKIIKDMFTESNNETTDLTKILACATVLCGLVLSAYSVIIKGTPFVYQDFGIGTAAVFGGLAAVFNLKKETPIENTPL